MRLPWAAIAGGTLVAAVGVAGLVRASMPQSVAAAASITSDAPPIVVTGAYIRPPLAPTKTASAYFSIRNTTGTPDVLESVDTGAGATAELHSYQSDGVMVALASGLPIPAHGVVTLTPGKTHIMIAGIYGTLQAGQTVNIDLQFRNAGALSVVAPVISYADPAPDASTPATSGASTTPSTSPSATAATPSGAHS